MTDAECHVVMLSPDDCLRLLPACGLGWVSYVRSGEPQLMLVNFVVQAGEVVFETGYENRLAAAVQEPLMSFGTESMDTAHHTGWYVTVTGRARLIGDDLVNHGLPRFESWTTPGACLRVGIPIDRVCGRRVEHDQQRRLALVQVSVR
ncbi:pyridoxamine 5'-phosphate oxidase family protein [Georgenia sp. SYP-B2076]|uniref:pyridoxamine 5'-phosphate oxidase family protein n=1 Tax=Georgenia sp. SYP-B2076 TaxID=2495881 RepID=UPI0013DF7CD1|nr:pyridoxamine 5'-phosphate oxidase family protein [Georgenia sp. SYP-B2076]